MEEPKKAAKGRKRERSGIPPPFFVSVEKLYSILKAWVKDGVVVFRIASLNQQKRKSKVCFTVGTIEGVVTTPWTVML